MPTQSEFVDLFRAVGVKDPEQWAAAEVRQNLGNLPKAAFLRQAWNEIPGSTEVAWLKAWIESAERQPAESHIVEAYKRLLATGCNKSDLILLLRGTMAHLLYRIAYLLDDPSLDDDRLQEEAQWGLYQESDVEEPIRRLGCLHELVFSVDPEYNGG